MPRVSLKTLAVAGGFAAGLVLLSACAAGYLAGPIPTPEFSSPAPLGILTRTADPAAAVTPAPPFGATLPAATGVLPTAGATVTPPETPAATITPATPCANQACALAAGHFLLDRPIPSGSGFVDYVDRSYPYGSTQAGQREPHHGVEFFNGAGTPIIAAGAGVVMVAGQDDSIAYGPATKFYGKLVVVRLDEEYQGQPVFNLSGHMQSILVTAGQHVNAGDSLGRVGSTGVAIGAHLHFEVRVGFNDYTATRNPELWLKPLNVGGKMGGAIAGRVMDLDGNLLTEITVVIRPLSTDTDKPRSRFVLTYASDRYRINGDDQLQENFAIGDMPAGLYSISVSTSKFYPQTLTVVSNQTAWVTFRVKPPAEGDDASLTPEAVTDTPESAASQPTETPQAKSDGKSLWTAPSACIRGIRQAM